jgi:Holliday junction resolvase RusA-like endonuclease
VEDRLSFTVYVHPEPQGSSRAFVNKKTGRAIITSANPKMKPYRQAVTQTVLEALHGERPFAGKHVPVWISLNFFFQKPPSCPKRRIFPVVKPDVDKLVRATFDALTGALYEDDAQVVELTTSKNYGTPERVEIIVRKMAEEIVAPIAAPSPKVLKLISKAKMVVAARAGR